MIVYEFRTKETANGRDLLHNKWGEIQSHLNNRTKYLSLDIATTVKSSDPTDEL